MCIMINMVPLRSPCFNSSLACFKECPACSAHLKRHIVGSRVMVVLSWLRCSLDPTVRLVHHNRSPVKGRQIGVEKVILQVHLGWLSCTRFLLLLSESVREVRWWFVVVLVAACGIKQNESDNNTLNVIELTGGLHCFTGLKILQAWRTSSLAGPPGLLDWAVMVELRAKCHQKRKVWCLYLMVPFSLNGWNVLRRCWA